MSRVFFDISVSLDGYVAGPNDSVDNGLGDGGEQLHEWVVGLESWRRSHGREGGSHGRDDELLERTIDRAGAVVMGRRMFDHAEDAWGEEPPFGAPVFVLTHRPREPEQKLGGTSYAFVTDGIESAVDQARKAADGRDVSIAGGASAIQQALRAGLVDDFQLHLVPVLLGGGVPLFEGRPFEGIQIEPTESVASKAVTHLGFRVVPAG